MYMMTSVGTAASQYDVHGGSSAASVARGGCDNKHRDQLDSEISRIPTSCFCTSTFPFNKLCFLPSGLDGGLLGLSTSRAVICLSCSRLPRLRVAVCVRSWWIRQLRRKATTEYSFEPYVARRPRYSLCSFLTCVSHGQSVWHQECQACQRRYGLCRW